MSETALARPPSLITTGSAGAGELAHNPGHKPAPKWFALRLRSNMEFQVRDALEANGIPPFLPTWSETVQWTDRKKTTVRPLFPGYVFARMTPGAQFHAALSTRGVIQILPDSFKPTPIDATELEDVQRVVASKLRVTPCDFAAGERVTIDSGAMTGVSGVVTRTKGAMRVVVSVELLHRSVSIELDADTLIRVPAVAA